MRTSSLLPLISPLLLALSACGSPEVIDNLSGTVVDMYGAPTPDVRVQVGERIVTTDAAGHFSFRAVTSPYDVALLQKDNPSPFLFFGLTGAAPTLAMDDRVSPKVASDAHSASITLDLSVEPTSTEQIGFLVNRLDDPSHLDLITGSGTTPEQIVVTVLWKGSSSTTVRVQVLRYQVDKSGTPQHYTGYDSVMLPLAAGDATSWTASWKTPPFGEAKLAVSADLPSGYKVTESDVGLHQDGWPYGQRFAWSTSTSTNVSFVVPDLDDLSLDLTVCASNLDSSSCRIARRLTAGTKGTTIELDEGPLAHTVDGVGVGSEISWDRNGDGTMWITLSPEKPNAGPTYSMTSSGDSLTLPDLSKLGTELPPGVSYRLDVFRNSALPTVDDLAAKGPRFAPSHDASTFAHSGLLHLTTR